MITLNNYPDLNASLTLNRSIGRYTLVFDNLMVEQRICEFLSTYSVITSVNLEEYLTNTSDNYDFLKIPLTASGKNIELGIHQFISFKKLYEEEMQQLQLEDMLIRLKISVNTEELIFV